MRCERLRISARQSSPGRSGSGGGGGQIQGGLHLGQQERCIERFGEVAENAFGGGFHRIRNRAVRSEQDDRQGGVPTMNFVEQAESIHAGKLDVAQDDPGAFRGQTGQGFLGAGRADDPVTRRTQTQGEQMEEIRIIVHQQDGRAIHRQSSSVLARRTPASSSCRAIMAMACWA